MAERKKQGPAEMPRGKEKDMRTWLCLLLALSLMAAAFPAAAEGKEETTVDGTVFHDGRDTEDNCRVFYEIFVGSFSDSDGDGTGDLRGIINRLDYLNDGDPASGESLGVEGIWLTPVFRSPSYHKYDVTDYYEIDSAFGTEDDLRELIDGCHTRGIKLILDLPLNHTGDENEWFKAFARAHREGDDSDPYYNFYKWIPEGEEVPAGRRFMKLEGTDVLYECNFSDQMPELDFDSELAWMEAVKIGQHYLKMGADGFRFDAAKYIYFGDHEINAVFWKKYMEKLREIRTDVYAVAEVWDGDAITDRYAGAVNCFRFSTSGTEGAFSSAAKGGNAGKLAKNIADYLASLRAINPEAMHVPFLANHDTDRAAGYLPVSGGRAAMAANLYLLTPGSPFIYYGEEIGLKGSRGGAETDANRRLAMRWGDGDTVADPEGSDYENQTESDVNQQEADPESLLNHYKKVIAARKANPEIARGECTALEFPDSKAGGFLFTWQGSTVAVLHNTTKKEVTLDLKAAGAPDFTEIAAVLDTVPGKGGAALEGSMLTLLPFTSVILR